MKIGNIYTILGICLLLAAGCGERGKVTLYDKEIKHIEPKCVRLTIWPSDPKLRKIVEHLVRIEDLDCPYGLEISTKTSIHCNSAFNAPLKSTSNFPDSFLRIDLRKGMRVLADYYIDLTEPPDENDIENAIEQMQNAGIILPR